MCRRICLPASRSSCQSGISATTRARLVWITFVAWRTFLRSCGSPSSALRRHLKRRRRPRIQALSRSYC